MNIKLGYAADTVDVLTKGAGYDLNLAIAELIDNSIGADSDEIRITAYNGHFTIEDKGENAGMDEKTFKKNFFYVANSSTKKKKNAAGKFGIGGKTAIMAIKGDMECDVEITTHKKGSKPIWATWPIRRGRCDECEGEFLDDDTMPYGTTFDFDCANDIDTEALSNFISVRYCWAIKKGVKIYVNNTLVMPNDPLYRCNNNVIKNDLYSSKTFRVKGEEVEVNVVSFKSGNIIPEEELHSWDSGGSKKKSLSTANRSGIYVITEGRYYTTGNNFDTLMGGTAHASLDGLRIEVCIPKSLWNIIGMTWNKGEKLTPFTKIDAFNTGDVNTGVADYIRSVMSNFKNEKETTPEKNAKKVSKTIEDTINQCDINVKVIASDTKKGEFINYKDDILTFDISHTYMGRKEIEAVVNALIITFDSIIKNGQENTIGEIIMNLNNKLK